MPSTRRSRLTTLMPLCTLLAISACAEIDVPSNCFVDSNDVARRPGYDFQIIHEQPNSCPVTLTSAQVAAGGRRMGFEAAITVKKNVLDGFTEVRFYDRLNAQHFADRLLIYPTDDFRYPTTRDRVDVLGEYTAGAAGRSAFGVTERDLATLSTPVIADGPATASVRLTYTFLVSANVVAPSDVEEGSGFWVSPEVNDPMAVYPLTYAWYQDGTPMGGPTQDPSPIYVPGQSGGSTLTFHTIVTDATGHSFQTAFHNVWIYFTGGCDEPPCSR